MILRLFFITLGVFLFLFFFWKKLKDDYEQEHLFNSAFFILIGLGMGKVVSRLFLPDWWFWLSFLGSLLGLWLVIVKFKLKAFEVIEAWVLASLPLLGLVFFDDWLQAKNFYSFLGFVVVLILLALFFYLDKHYKTYTWYRSGKIGFSALTVLGLFFLIRATVAVLSPNMLSLVGTKDVFFSGVLAFSCFLIIFNLAKKTT